MNIWLLDAGPLVALNDPRDAGHESVRKAFRKFNGQLVTTTAVIAESMYFAVGISGGPERLVRFLELSRAQIADYSQLPHLRRAVELMNKYRDTPMDFADASLVMLGEALRINLICTLDRRGFSTFRMQNGKSFELVLDF